MHLDAATALFATLALVTPVAAVVPQLPGWTLVWADDFNAPSNTLPSSANWIIDKGTQYPGGPPHWGTSDVQVYTASTKNLFQSQGDLYIRPLRSNTGQWTSARIETRRKDFKARPGGKLRIQARIAMPGVNGRNGLGYWPAFWTMGGAFRGDYNNWPMVGEYDIMENVNGLNSVNSGLHCDTNPGGVCNEPSGLTVRGPCTGSNCNGNFHTYSVVVDRSTTPEQISFLTDGKLLKQVTSNDIGDVAWNRTTHNGHFILLNVAIGGAYPDALTGFKTPTQATVSGKSMRIRYVAVYEQ